MAYALCSRDGKLDVVGCLLSFRVWQSDETNVESRVDAEAWIPDGRWGVGGCLASAVTGWPSLASRPFCMVTE